MKIADLEKQVDLLSLIEEDHEVTKVGNQYRVDPCPVCGSREHFTIYPETNSYSSFNDCCNGGGVYKYLMEVEKLDEDQAHRKLSELAGDTPEIDFNMEKAPNTKPAKVVEEAPIFKDYTESLLKLYYKQTENQKEYFINRGISKEIIEKYKLCIGDLKGYGDNRAILPTWKDGKIIYWTGRALTEKQEAYRKYDNAKGPAPFFGLDNLTEADPGEIIIVTEGIFDALSFESIGYRALSMHGIKPNKLKEITEAHNNLIFLTALDNDGPGQDATNRINDLMNFKAISIPKPYGDINDWFKSNLDGFKESVKEQIEGFKRPDNLYSYMLNDLSTDINAYQEFKDRKTGFENLDAITSLYPGLYVIGGLSTLGKTTFIHQLVDQMTAKGEHTLFFSLEMSTLELMTKSIARSSVLNNGLYNFDNGVSALDIRLNNIPNRKKHIVEKAIKDYKPIAKRFNIIEGNFNTNIDSIRKYVNDYILLNGVKPVVVIDYLQIIPGRETDRSDKERVDGVVTELKRMSRDFNISVLVVSSLNRSNYLSPIDFESFKESGGIEYTADVVWGLQLQAIHDEIFNSSQKIKEKREVINRAKKAMPRKIELVCLKNRNGISNYSCIFDYHPQHDLFISQEKYDSEFDFDEEMTVRI